MMADAAPRAQKSLWRSHLLPVASAVVPPAALLALLALGWQLVALRNKFLLPSLGAVGSELTSHPREYLDAAATTLQETGVGLGVSFVVAFGLAVAMGHFKVVERAVMPLAVVINVTPVVALAPGLATALGFGYTPRYIVTGIIVFFPLLINSLAGLRSADPEALRYFVTLNASRWDILYRLRLPSSLPFLFAAARICFPLSLIGAVVAEFTAAGNENGLGSLIYISDENNYLAGMYSGVFCLSVLGLLVTLLVVLVERRVLAWHPSVAQ
ncbi:MAG TPA: ABC transporter permease subunit [Acidimicrobiales bacterium]|nr:ABC transporter permease subunit [Acidimicrobiales bacterium]